MCSSFLLPDSFLSLSVDREDFSSCPYVLLIRSVALLTKSMHSEYSTRPFNLIRSPVSLKTFIEKLSDTQYFHIFIVQATDIVATHAFNTVSFCVLQSTELLTCISFNLHYHMTDQSFRSECSMLPSSCTQLKGLLSFLLLP